MLKNVKEVREWHPLCQKEINFSLTWQEWKKCFEEARKAYEILGLLHYGFDVDVRDENEYRERIIYYLEMAYGYDSLSLFSSIGERRDENFRNIFGRCTSEEAKKKIAQKAWAMLCQRFFKNTEKSETSNPSWWWLVRNDSQILDKILWFFSEKDNIPRRNRTDEHNNRIALDFLYTLAKYAWSRHSGRHHYGEKPLPHFVKNRPKFIRILSHLGKLYFLVDNWEMVTKSDLIALKELALYEDGKKGGKKKYKTISEAAIGSFWEAKRSVAQVLIILEPMIEEKKRQEQAKDLKIKIKKLEKKKEALEG